MDSKFRPEPTYLCTYCEVCKRQFETRERFEHGCILCSPIVVQKPHTPREWFSTE